MDIIAVLNIKSQYDYTCKYLKLSWNLPKKKRVQQEFFLNHADNIFNGKIVQNLWTKKHSVLWNMMTKTRRKREVTTDTYCMKESESHQKTSQKSQPGKFMKDMGNPTARDAGACVSLNRKTPPLATNQMNWGQGSVKPIKTQWCITLNEPIRNDPKSWRQLKSLLFQRTMERYHRWTNHPMPRFRGQQLTRHLKRPCVLWRGQF